jgi:phosphoribosylamine-glycine ligase
MKFLFVTREALSVDLAWQLTKEGHEVSFYVQNQSEKDVGDGFVAKVDQWEPQKDWADVIIFDDIGFAATADKLRAEGKFVVGGTPYTDKLEDDREFGQEELKKVGVNILPSWNFTSFDEAVAFMKLYPDRYVIKPSGKAQNEKELLFVGQEEDGKDVEQVLEHYKQKWSSKIKIFLLQKYAQGVEVAVGAFFNGNDFIEPININFEHKRLFPNDIGPSTGEMGCYDDKTEVLTEGGWKFFKDLSREDDIFTLNPSNHEIEFNKPDALVSFTHHKKLISIQNRTLDIVVTPDHNMYVESQQDARKHMGAFKFVKAKDLQYQSRIKRTATWIGTERAVFALPSVSFGHYEGRQVVLHETGELQIPMDDWMAFIGIWLADGYASCNGDSFKIGVSQKKGLKTQKIADLLSRLPFSFMRGENEFYCYDKQLGSFLDKFGGAHEKHVPNFVKELSPRQIAVFLDWYWLGDGTLMNNGFRIFYSASRDVADDVQELLLKVGRVGIVKKRARTGTVTIEGHTAHGSGPRYEVLERVRQLDSWVDKRDIRTVDYDGTVYCATVKNHIMYVRRNGKPYWCGNTSMYWSKTNPIFEMTLLKMKDLLRASKYVGYIDINCIANSKGVFPLEFTTRFGYPTISIHMEGVLSEWGTFLSDLAHGKPTQFKCKKGYQVGVVIAVPPFPFEDEKAFRKYSEDATILFKKPNLNGIHIGEVKTEGGDWKLAGHSGYSLIVTGSGVTMQEAITQAYQSVRNVMIPNMFYRDDIGRRWSRDVDMLFAWGYL